MATVQLGDFPFDMFNNQMDFGLFELGFFSDDGDPVIDVFTQTLVVARDPITNTRLTLTGTFYENPVGDQRSMVTGIEAHTAAQQLILSMQGVSIALDDLFPDEGDPRLVDLLTGDDLVQAGAVSAVLFGYHGNDTLVGGPGNDRLYGGQGDDLVMGGAGNDTLIIGNQNDTLLGGDGLDTVFSNQSLTRFAVAVLAEGILLTDVVGTFGTDLVGWDVERATFPETSFALDLGRGQNAGDAIALLWAAFNALPSPQDVGRWIAAFDAGGTMVGVAQQMIDHYTGGAGVSNADLVTLLFTNIVGRAPDSAELGTFVGMIEGGMSQAELFVMAADLDANRVEFASVIGIAAPYAPFPG